MTADSVNTVYNNYASMKLVRFQSFENKLYCIESLSSWYKRIFNLQYVFLLVFRTFKVENFQNLSNRTIRLCII